MDHPANAAAPSPQPYLVKDTDLGSCAVLSQAVETAGGQRAHIPGPDRRRMTVDSRQRTVDNINCQQTVEPGPLFPGTRAPAVPGHEKSARPF